MSETVRDLAAVINRILEVIPAEETFLRTNLEWIRDDSWFLPPEGKQPAWAALRAALIKRFPEPTAGWPTTVSNIVRGIET